MIFTARSHSMYVFPLRFTSTEVSSLYQDVWGVQDKSVIYIIVHSSNIYGCPVSLKRVKDHVPSGFPPPERMYIMPRQSWGEVYERKGVGVSPGQDGRGSPFLLPRHPVFPPPISIGSAQYNLLGGGGGHIGIVFVGVEEALRLCVPLLCLPKVDGAERDGDWGGIWLPLLIGVRDPRR